MTSEGFPAHAGMNRECLEEVARLIWVPRTRGDEPALFYSNTIIGLGSPHTRG